MYELSKRSLAEQLAFIDVNCFTYTCTMATGTGLQWERGDSVALCVADSGESGDS